jgi:Fe-S oxidoreductase
MAGAFGASESEYELSVQVGNQLAELLNQYPEKVQVISNGTSCRHQIEHLTDRNPLHIAEVLAKSIRKP